MSNPKVLPAILFILLSSFIGLSLGNTIGGLFFVPPGSGLAGPAIALGYGVLGLVLALAMSILMARHLTVQRLRTALLGVGVVSLGIAAFFTYRMQSNRTEINDREAVKSPIRKRID